MPDALPVQQPLDDAPAIPLTLPPAVPDAPRPGFPLLATVAPVLGATALWMITGSTFALLFAALGPVVAIAAMLDARRQARTRTRRATAAREAALVELGARIASRHAAELDDVLRRHPTARRSLVSPAGARWAAAAPDAIVIGSGPIPSGVRVSGTPVDDADVRLLVGAGTLDGGPVTAALSTGLGFVGTTLLTEAAVRAVLVQLGDLAAPGTLRLEAPPGPAWSWLRTLPHHGRLPVVVAVDGRRTPTGRATASEAAWTLAIATDPQLIPPEVRTVVRIVSPALAVVERECGLPGSRAIVPDLVSLAEAAEWADRQRLAAERAGADRAESDLARTVAFDDLDQPRRSVPERGSLGVAIGATASGPQWIDLVRDGPHALVAGTSGSGKSEFLLTWIAALAVAHPPELVAFLLIDFKGGAAFEPLRGLPHVAGIVTDLDESEARRAVESLRAELRTREGVLRDARVGDIAALGPDAVLPRLVIVVDEYQAMIARFADLADVIADLAARGRSLGVHLVLSAQRPNGVVREQVSANCGLRISLRVLDRADSIAVVGDPRAAELDASAPGRGIVLTAERGATEFQTALTGGALERVRARASGDPVRRPWLDPLPDRIEPDSLRSHASLTSSTDPDAGRSGDDGTALPFGLVDEPDRQRRSIATWDPASDGNLLVAGRPGSGRSTALGATARAFADRHGTGAVVVLGGPRSAEWDRIHAELGRVRDAVPAAPRLIVIDDLDARHRAWPDEHRFAAQAAIEELLREGRASGVRVAAGAVSAQGLPGAIREGFTAALLLQHGSRAELVHAGGTGELWRSTSAPGRGQWFGRAVQVVDAVPPTPGLPPPPAPLVVDPAQPLAVVSDAVDADARALTALGREVIELGGAPDQVRSLLAAIADGAAAPPVVVGAAEAWAGGWALLASIRERGVLVAHGGTAEFRAISRDRRPPPLLDPGRGQCWATTSEPGAGLGTGIVRAAWPSAVPAPGWGTA